MVIGKILTERAQRHAKVREATMSVERLAGHGKRPRMTPAWVVAARCRCVEGTRHHAPAKTVRSKRPETASDIYS